MIYLPLGFRFAGVHCGLKKNNHEDLSIILSDTPATAAAMYTQNRVVAAPVLFDRERTPSSNMRAVVINSGNANACTGEQGDRDARRMAELTASACGVDENQVLVLSTGIIGEHLNMNKLERGIPDAGSKLERDEASLIRAARGMMTTDKSHKIATQRIEVGDETITITGLAKGAGMIGPRMATMLSVIMTDATLGPAPAQAILQDVVDTTFNCISVEGHTSTNDTVILLANGSVPCGEERQASFEKGLLEVCTELARSIPADGEGASHLIEITVEGCARREDAQRIARTIADSALVKTAIAGNDPNWGRIVSAAGYAGIEFDPDQVELELNGVLLFRDGSPIDFDAAAVSRSLKDNHESRIRIVFQEGEQSCRFWTSDLTHEYVRINAEYHT